MIISSSYLIISFHPKSLQNHKKSTNFDIFRIQKRIQKDFTGEKQPGPVSSYQYVAVGMLGYFQNAKTMIFDDFFGFFLFLSFFPKSVMIFVSQHGNMHPGRCFRDLVQPGWVVTSPTGP